MANITSKELLKEYIKELRTIKQNSLFYNKKYAEIVDLKRKIALEEKQNKKIIETVRSDYTDQL